MPDPPPTDQQSTSTTVISRLVGTANTYNGLQVASVSSNHFSYIPVAPPPKALEEEEYLDSVARIIQRDFFPDLEELRLKKALSESIQSQDLAKRNEISLRLDDIAGSSKDPAASYSLDQFQTKFTSEDNASFDLLVHTELAKKRERYFYFYEGEQAHRQLEHTQTLAVDGISKPINTWTYEAKSAIMYGAEGVPLTTLDIPVSRAGPKSVNYPSTRLPPALANKEDAPAGGATPTAEQAAQHRLHTNLVWKNMTAQTPALRHATGGESPFVHGQYKMVAATPDLRPGLDINPGDLMTWGMIESTPMRVDGGSTPRRTAGGFSIAPTPARELQTIRLSEEVMRRGVRAKSSVGAAGSGAGGVFKKPGRGPMSPAVHALARMVTGGKSAVRDSIGLRAAYTPKKRSAATPIQFGRTGTGTPQASSGGKGATPARRGGEGSATPAPEGRQAATDVDVTSGLLDLDESAE